MCWAIDVPAEVAQWYDGLSARDLAVVDRVLDRLQSAGYRLGLPRSRPLGAGLHELRFAVDDTERRIT